jgi:AcrR family transcriptional regulator
VPASTVSARRGPGRPPDLSKRQAIIDATLEVLAEVGYASMTIDAVAQRARSNRVLIYRVWDTKVALARDAIFGPAESLVVPDTGSVLDDLRGFLRPQVERMRRPAYVKGAPALTVELLSDPELFRETYEQFIKPTEDGFAVILDRARARGEIVVDADPKVLTRVVSGTTTSLAQATKMSAEAITDLLVELLTAGLIR